MSLQLVVYRRTDEIPDLEGKNIFHSRELFQVYEATPEYTPLFIVATENGKPVACMLATMRKAKKWLPSFLTRQCIVCSEGDFLEEAFLSNKEKSERVFGEMLGYLTKEALRSCFSVEFRNLENAIFGYKSFKDNNYFPVNWVRVHNSLHSMKNAEDRFSISRIRQVRKGLKNGAVAMEARTMEEVLGFSKMLRKIYLSHVHKYFPTACFFRKVYTVLVPKGLAKIFIVKYKERIIGGSLCVYSDKNAYLWFTGGMRKTYALQYPGILAVWKAMQDAHECGFHHLEFMDAGLPFRKRGYRNFVLRFGGKQNSTRRWFRFKWGWLNRFFARLYA